MKTKDGGHKERAHSKFSASGAERWFACPGSVALSEGIPSKDNEYSLEGTKAHEVLEQILRHYVGLRNSGIEEFLFPAPNGVSDEMLSHGTHAASFIMKLAAKAPEAPVMVEERVYLDFLHPEAFGTIDVSIVEHFGTLHVLDYKYGMSLVSPKENLQFLFYALAIAHKWDWNFERVRMWTLQPRVKGFDGYTFWDISIKELRAYVPIFKAAIDRIERFPNELKEGDHCHWCKAKKICPLKMQTKLREARTIFKELPPDGCDENHNETGKRENESSYEKSRKETRSQKAKENNQEEEDLDEKESEEGRPRSEADWRKEEIRKAKEALRKRKAKKESSEAQRPRDFFKGEAEEDFY